MALIIRSYKPSDAAVIDEIYERCHGHFNLPDINKCIRMAVIESDGKVIALGAFQIIPELILVIDNDIPKRERVEALKQLLIASEFTANIENFKDVYAFPDSDKFADVLKKHFNFRDGNHILIKRVDDGE